MIGIALLCAIVQKTSKKILTGSMLAPSWKPLATVCTTNLNKAHLLSIESTKRRSHVTLGERHGGRGVWGEAPGNFWDHALYFGLECISQYHACH